MNTLSQLMDMSADVKQVETVLGRLGETVQRFMTQHEEYQAMLPEKERESDQIYCDTRMEIYEQFHVEVSGWIEAMNESEAELEGVTLTGTRITTPGRIDRTSFTASRTGPTEGTVHAKLAQATANALSAVADTQRDLTKQMRIPRAELEIFDGDETRFRAFLVDFQECVAKWADNDRECLTQLRAFTAGTPHQLVQGCVHLPPSQGYAEALRLLETRYGAPYCYVSARWQLV